MSRFMEIKSNDPISTQKQIAQQFGYSDFSSNRYRGQINMFSLYDRKNTRRKKLTSQEVSITWHNVKTGECETDNNVFSAKKLIDDAFIIN